MDGRPGAVPRVAARTRIGSAGEIGKSQPLCDPADVRGMTTSIEPRPRWIGVGTSTDVDSTRAGVGAATAALRGGDPKLLIVFASDSHDFGALLAGVNETSGGVPLIGCSTAGEIWTDGPEDASVVVTAFGGEGFDVSTTSALGVSEDQRGAGAAAAATVADLDERPHRVLLLLTDGLAGGQEEVVRGAYGVSAPACRWSAAAPATTSKCVRPSNSTTTRS